MDRRAVGEALEEIAALMELKGENPFRCRAFANGARVVVGMTDFEDRVAAETLTGVKGIGEGLAAEIEALARTGASPMLAGLRREVPGGLREIATVPGLGPKKARALHDEHGLHSISELEYACRQNRLAGLKGFGGKTQAKILEWLAARKRNEGLLRRDEVRALEEMADAAARKAGGRAYVCGAYRRGELLCDGIDLVVIGPDQGKAARERVLEALPLEPVVALGNGLVQARLNVGAEARIAASSPAGAGAALVGSTGPRAHADAVLGRWLAAHPDEPMCQPDETAFYAEAGLPYVPPELRGDGTEIEAALAGKLPRLLERAAIRGCVHSHTTWSDGTGSVAEMLDAAAAAGLSWVGISDHSPTASYAGGLTVERLAMQQTEIDAEAAKRPALTVLKGTECDILGEGALDYPREVLDRFDFVVASVHSLFTMKRAAMTARVIRAVEDRATNVLGHPTGRLLLGRPGYELDVPEVLRACAREGVAIELNAHPARLDIDPQWLPLVRDFRVTVSIGPDAHEPAGFTDLDHGVAVARRAALPPDLVLNTRDAGGARAFFAERRRRAARRSR